MRTTGGHTLARNGVIALANSINDLKRSSMLVVSIALIVVCHFWDASCTLFCDA